MKIGIISTLAVLACSGAVAAQSFDAAAADAEQKRDQSIAELNALRDLIAQEKIPLSIRLNELQAERTEVRSLFDEKSRLLDRRVLDLSTLTTDIEGLRAEASYLTTLLGSYTSEFESRLHIAEVDRYETVLDAAKLAPENENLTDQEVYAIQLELLTTSIGRLEEALGGTRFNGAALDADRILRDGTFVLVGPTGLFRSADGETVGSIKQRLDSFEATVVPFAVPDDAQAAAHLVNTGAGRLPFDVTLGDAHEVEATEEQPLIEHLKDGGEVMIPIGVLAGLALLVALIKWLALSTVRKPGRRSLAALLEAIRQRDETAIQERANRLKGPAGKMLQVGVAHIDEPRELIEEVMYEQVLTTRLKVQRMLPFIAITAAAAPLLGLLGTVTGIIDTFQLITIFGSGDVKQLSGGISEALITTKFGLIVAIPALLFHAFLSRKARGIVDHMERAGIAFVNQVSKTPLRAAAIPAPVETTAASTTPETPSPTTQATPPPTSDQVKEALAELLVPMVQTAAVTPSAIAGGRQRVEETDAEAESADLAETTTT